MKCFMGFLPLALLLMYLPLKPKTISSKIICLDCPLLYFVLGKKGLLAQAPPLDFHVHPHQPSDHVLVKTWKENKLEPVWERTFPGPADHRKETTFWTMIPSLT
jgi:hypothetical protein